MDGPPPSCQGELFKVSSYYNKKNVISVIPFLMYSDLKDVLDEVIHLIIYTNTD